MVREALWLDSPVRDLWDGFVPLTYNLNILVGEARRHQTFQAAKRDLASCPCAECGATGRVQIHHSQPLWALALEYLCEQGKLFSMPLHLFPAWNSLENLRPLCRTCHGTIETSTRAHWRTALQQRFYPHLHYSYRDCKRAFARHWKYNPVTGLYHFQD
jgi:hypothetical protein